MSTKCIFQNKFVSPFFIDWITLDEFFNIRLVSTSCLSLCRTWQKQKLFSTKIKMALDYLLPGLSDLLKKYQAVISGSFILKMITNCKWNPNDIDIYHFCTLEKTVLFKDFASCTCFPFQDFFGLEGKRINVGGTYHEATKYNNQHILSVASFTSSKYSNVNGNENENENKVKFDIIRVCSTNVTSWDEWIDLFDLSNCKNYFFNGSLVILNVNSIREKNMTYQFPSGSQVKKSDFNKYVCSFEALQNILSQPNVMVYPESILKCSNRRINKYRSRNFKLVKTTVVVNNHRQSSEWKECNGDIRSYFSDEIYFLNDTFKASPKSYHTYEEKYFIFNNKDSNLNNSKKRKQSKCLSATLHFKNLCKYFVSSLNNKKK